MRPFRLLLLLAISLVACNPGQADRATPAPPEPLTLPSSTFPTAVLRASETAPPSPAPPEVAHPTATLPPRRKVFVISWDGGQAGLVYDWMANGVLPHFNALAQQGLRAEYAQTVDPSLTASAQNSLSTGSYPSHTGIVSNNFHNPNDSFYWYRSGFEAALDNAEPVWVSAGRAGLVTAAIFFIGASLDHPLQTADYTLGYGARDAYSRQEVVRLNPLNEPWKGQIPASFSPPYEGSFQIAEVARVHLYALDSQDDGLSNYDTVLLNSTRLAEPATLRLHAGQWGSLVLLPKQTAGADFLIQDIGWVEDSLQVTLFHSQVAHNTGAPRAFLEAVNREFGFFPSGPDAYAVEHGWITEAENMVLRERSARWMAEVAAWVYAEYQPDLIFTWQEGFDSAGHAFLLTDPRQPNYSPERAAQCAKDFQQAARIADQALGILLDPVDWQDTTVLLVADHGMAPIHTTVYVNTLLEQAGLLVLDKRNYVVVEKTSAFAVASGGAVHVYLNLEGHEKDGSLSPEEYSRVQQKILELLQGLTDPASGAPVFQHVLRQAELAALRLEHPNSGDVFAQAYPGYNLDGWRGNDSIFEPATYSGQHGYDSSLPEMQTLFIAAGGGVSPSGLVIPPVRVVDYAPTIAALLGFPPAATVDGTIIPAFLPFDPEQ